MTEHPENTPVSRFFAFWWAVGGVLVFGLLVLVIAGGSGGAGNEGVEAYDESRAAARSSKLVEVRKAQSALLAGSGEAVEGAEGKIRVPIEVAAKLVLKEGTKSVPRVTAVPVPGTPAALELMKKEAEAQAAADKAAAAEKEKEAGEAAPEKSESEKPAAGKKAGQNKGKGKGAAKAPGTE